MLTGNWQGGLCVFDGVWVWVHVWFLKKNWREGYLNKTRSGSIVHTVQWLCRAL